MSLEHLESVSLPIDLSRFDDIIDVRTPLEFEEDHLPGALNLPVLSNEQRAEVGTLHKAAGFDGRRLGARYVSEAIARHLAGELAARPPGWSPLVYCWRGGMRSRSLTTVLRSIGWRARVLEGGYKAYRRFVMEDLANRLAAPDLELRVIAGLTGTGKTRLLHELRDLGAQIVDLEGMANHRGSLLGSQGVQPTQRQFESRLHTALCSIAPSTPIFVEAESNRVGSINLPPALWKKLGEAPVIELTLPVAERVQLLLEDYEHFPRNPEELTTRIDPLRKLRGHQQVDHWQNLITAGAWPEFVGSILKDHYDLCYRRPGSSGSNYRAPSQQLALQDRSPESYSSAARSLIE